LPGLSSNCDPPDLCLWRSYNYRYDPLVPSGIKDLVPQILDYLKEVAIISRAPDYLPQ
jgi:hypothetical protein